MASSPLPSWRREPAPLRVVGAPLDVVRAPTQTDPEELLRAIGELRSALDERLALLDDYVARLTPSVLAATSPADGARVAVYCLGPFRLRIDDSPVDSWRSNKALALFQYLVTRHKQLVPRDTLIETLWGDPAAIAGGTSLKVAVHSLRQALGQGDAGSPLAIVTAGSAYRLEADGLWLDVDEFERVYALGRGREVDGDIAGARALFEVAADLYHGDFLEDVVEDWAIYRREALRDQHLYVLGRLAQTSADAGDYQDALERCQRILAQDPCHEGTYRLLMLCHSRLGQRLRVRSWYELCARRLRSELDCAPDPETERVFRQAIAGRA